MKTIDGFNFNGKRAIIRVDFNVPLDENQKITDTTRIDAAVPTIKKILNDGGSVVLMSHLGRPKKNPDPKYSLKPLLPYLNQIFGQTIKFADDCMSEDAENQAKALKAGEILLLENLRFYAEEEGKPRLGDDATDEEKAVAKKALKEQQKSFTKRLASYADVYVNDAFGTAHRAHASTALIADCFDAQHKMFGYIMANEVKNIGKVLTGNDHPFTAIIGGAKVSSKIQIVENLLNKVDNMIIGGGMMFTFIKAMGGNVGNSLVEDDFIDLAKETLKKAADKGVKIYLPTDVVIADKFDNEAHQKTAAADTIPDGWMGLDISEQTIQSFSTVIESSKLILWNGPMGVFEMSSFENGTKKVAEAIARATQKGAFSLIGGGDSIAAINKYNMKDQVSYISTGGGAMLEFIEGKELPGVAAIEK
ncbi:MAG: phosphoglycerate kinase [Bacteroidales bacterium]|nr:phosphoglycerate kinase [Bacteroidales bacterium]